MQVLRAAGSASSLVPATSRLTRPRVALCRSSRGPYGAPMMYCDWDERQGAVRATSRRVLATLTPTSAHAACAGCTCEVNARGDRVHMPAGVGLRRAGGRPLVLLEQPSQVGLDGRGRRGRESRPHACSLVGTHGHTAFIRDVHMSPDHCCAPRRYVGFPTDLDLGSSHVPSPDCVCAWV